MCFRPRKNGYVSQICTNGVDKASFLKFFEHPIAISILRIVEGWKHFYFPDNPLPYGSYGSGRDWI